MGSIGNYDSELCQSGRSVFEWLWVLVGVGAGGARGALYLPMVRPSSYVASSSSLLTNGQTIAGIIIILRGIIITTNIIIAIINIFLKPDKKSTSNIFKDKVVTPETFLVTIAMGPILKVHVA